jgi:hypothetical protein
VSFHGQLWHNNNHGIATSETRVTCKRAHSQALLTVKQVASEQAEDDTESQFTNQAEVGLSAFNILSALAEPEETDRKYFN